MEGEDLYAVLGVAKTATEDELRRAYRKLAREHHPDLNPGKPEAEEKFKRLSAAYDVLSNPEKRRLYDEFGHKALKGGFDPEQARAYRRWADTRTAAGAAAQDAPSEYDLSDLLGAARRRSTSIPIDGEDLFARVELDLASALRGAEVELQVPTRDSCDVCAGSGEQPGSAPETCGLCNGAGKTQAVRGPMRMTTLCPRCHGDGKARSPCTHCAGRGFLISSATTRVRIPPGADDGSELRVRGKGAPGLFGGAAGDLVIETRIRPHPHFRREGLDLRLKLPITIAEAHRGGTVPVPTPTGTTQMKIPPRSAQGTQLRLKGKGVQRGDVGGDLYVELNVVLPEGDDPELTKAIETTERFYTRHPRDGITL